MDTCPVCEQPLSDDGLQPNVIRGTMSHLGSCVNPECENYQSTFGFGERQMTRDELKSYAGLRERLGIS